MLSKTHILSATAAVVMMMGAAVPASAITDTIFKYTNPKTGTLSISTMAFGPDGSSTAANSWFNSWSGNTLTGNGCFNTAITLPQGASITNLRVVFSKGIFVNFLGTARETGLSTTIASLSNTQETTDRIGISIPVSPAVTVNNVTTQYGLGICLAPDQSFFGARIQYTYTNAGD